MSVELESGRSQMGPFGRAVNQYATLVKWLAVGLILVSLILFMRTLPVDRGIELLKEWIRGQGILGIVVFGLAYVLATLLFLPGWILTVSAGALFGLLKGAILVSISSTTGAALAFLVARYVARERVIRQVADYPKFQAVDQAIGESGWKIVALLRLSPAIPFNLQNYLYGVTAIRFWPYVLASWVAMLPGTIMYVYIGSLGTTALQATAGTEHTANIGKWMLQIVGFLATVGVTVYVTRLARNAIRERTAIAEAGQRLGREYAKPSQPTLKQPTAEAAEPTEMLPWGALGTLGVAIVLVAAAGWAYARQGTVRQYFEALMGLPPSVSSREAYAPSPSGPAFDHALFDQLLGDYVDEAGYVDYEGLRQEPGRLERYLQQVADAPFDDLGRNEKLALLINAYNAFTLQLILEHYPVETIMDIPRHTRWDEPRWQIGSHTWSLAEIEHEQIRPKFEEPRIHFALVCAAVGCPPLRDEAYTGERIDEQLEDQARYVHRRDRWVRFDDVQGVVFLTMLYRWYAGDFQQAAGSVLQYAAQYSSDLEQALENSDSPQIRHIDYDWRLNGLQNKPTDTSEPPLP